MNIISESESHMSFIKKLCTISGFFIIQSLYVTLLLAVIFIIYYSLPRYLNSVLGLFVLPPLIFGLVCYLNMRLHLLRFGYLVIFGITSFTLWLAVTGILGTSRITDALYLRMNPRTYSIDMVNAASQKKMEGVIVFKNITIPVFYAGMHSDSVAGKHVQKHIDYSYLLPVVSQQWDKTQPVVFWLFGEDDSLSKEKSIVHAIYTGKSFPDQLICIPVYDAFTAAKARSLHKSAMKKYGLVAGGRTVFLSIVDSREESLSRGYGSMRTALIIIGILWVLLPAGVLSFLLIKK